MHILGRSTKILADNEWKEKSEEYYILTRVRKFLNDPTKDNWISQATYCCPISFYENEGPAYTKVNSYFAEWTENKRKLSIIQEDIKEYLY